MLNGCCSVWFDGKMCSVLSSLLRTTGLFLSLSNAVTYNIFRAFSPLVPTGMTQGPKRQPRGSAKSLAAHHLKHFSPSIRDKHSPRSSITVCDYFGWRGKYMCISFLSRAGGKMLFHVDLLGPLPCALLRCELKHWP